jgi:hypothetical protein
VRRLVDLPRDRGFLSGEFESCNELGTTFKETQVDNFEAIRRCGARTVSQFCEDSQHRACMTGPAKARWGALIARIAFKEIGHLL